jgi:hypothetical protein
MNLEFREVTCPVCFKKFITGSPKRKFCSADCRKRYWGLISRERRNADPIRRQRSLETLFAWKEAHRKPKQENYDRIDIIII